jgi:TRAP-type C4-dicarboxylate transport system substrate-binding protein
MNASLQPLVRCLLAVVAAAFLAHLSSVNAQQAPREWKLSTALGPAFALGKAGERWATLIAQGTSGRLPVKLHPGAALAQRDPLREFAVLRDGGADLAVGSTLFWSATVPELGVVGLPWLAPGWPQLTALAGESVTTRLAAALSRAGVEPLAFAPLGHRALATTARLVREPSDVTGMRVRVPALPPIVDIYTALGALPRSMSFADAQAAFKAGSLDAQEGNAASFAAARLDAVGLRHVADWNAVAEMAVFAVNRSVWNAWPEADRLRVREAAAEAAHELAALARKEADDALSELRRRGLTLTRATPDGHAAFALATRGVYERWAAVAGEDITRAAEAAVAAVPR